MTNAISAKTANTILYCKKWQEAVEFYRQKLQLPVTFAADWFVEFALCAGARVSIADERRARVKSSAGAGVTISLEVESADDAWEHLRAGGLAPQPLRDHPWGARAFYLFDPEGYRIEIWSRNAQRLAQSEGVGR
jgi:uncharacterized glyoxalase superfamily protein PhnB